MKRSYLKSVVISLLFGMIYIFVYAGDGQIDIAGIPYTISQSCSYVVVKDLEFTITDLIMASQSLLIMSHSI